MTSTDPAGFDPAGFDPEQTGAYRVMSLAEANEVLGQPVQPVEPEEAPPVVQPACGWNAASATTDCDWDRNCPVHGRSVRRQIEPAPPYVDQPYVSLVYVGTDGVKRRVDQDHSLISHYESTDADHRERLILKALLQHALAMLNGEDVT